MTAPSLSSQVAAIELAEHFNPLERRDSHGRWTKGGGSDPVGELGERLKAQGVPPGEILRQMAAAGKPVSRHGRIAGTWRPDVTDEAARQAAEDAARQAARPPHWSFVRPDASGRPVPLPAGATVHKGDVALKGHGAVVGRVIGAAGGHVAVDADDGMRHLIDWRNGGIGVHTIALDMVGPALPAGGTEGLLNRVMPEASPSPVRKPAQSVWSMLKASPVPEPAVSPKEAATTEALDKAITSDHEKDKKPGASIEGLEQAGGNANYFGNSADTDMVTFADGSKWVRKRGLYPDEMNREVLSSRISDVLGAGAPEVVDKDGFELWMPRLDATTAIEWVGGTDENEEPLGDNDPYEMYTSPQGIRIGILDNLIDNRDRHMGNWMVENDKDGNPYPVPIDHGNATFEDNAGYGSGSPFSDALTPESLSSIPAGTWDKWESGLQDLSPEFDKYGMSYEHSTVMANFAAMKP